MKTGIDKTSEAKDRLYAVFYANFGPSSAYNLFKALDDLIEATVAARLAEYVDRINSH